MTDYERGVCDGMQECIDQVSNPQSNWLGEWRGAAHRVAVVLTSKLYSRKHPGERYTVHGEMPEKWPHAEIAVEHLSKRGTAQ
jgi:hypothetical protein